MPAAIHPLKIPTVLVVDDEAESRERLRSAFAEVGYRSLSADTTASALQLLRGDSCDLVVLNFNLESNGGTTLCKLLRAQPLTVKLPIIALTTDDDPGQRAAAVAVGADESLSLLSSTAEVVSRAN